ncbi:4-hydroxybenzoate octaprenyltransferase [Amaricoccus tamworthensis]|uniref:4-hydroxybenzoate octaprenyltransferase n=1 Tax=Amaricoccus tamworthensis TaxID=57002 RepID=UPI003C7E5268
MNSDSIHSQPSDGRVADATTGNWVDRLAPEFSRPYLRLSRADRPIGTWLLLIPCWWAIFVAAMADPDGLGLWDAWLFLGCGIGAFLMRGAGCTWNDLTDQDFDAKVARTRSRPLPSGQVSPKQAFAWMCIQSLIAFCILLTFPAAAIWLGVLSLGLVAIYPFAKRFTWWPQIFLGLAFNWGAFLAYAAHDGTLGWPAPALYLAGIAWTLFYDTVYAHQDKEDDALIGVKSTARLFAEKTKAWLLGFQILATAMLTLAVFLTGTTPLSMGIALIGVAGFFLHLSWQLRTLDMDNPDNCLMLFRANRDPGLIAMLGFFLAALV